MKKEEYEYWINKYEIEEREQEQDCNQDYDVVWNSWTHEYEPLSEEHGTDMDWYYEDYYHNKFECVNNEE